MKQSRLNGPFIDAVIPRVTGARSASPRRIYAVSALFLGIIVAQLTHGAASPPFNAGASAVDISPPSYPVRVNAMFTERSADATVDPLYARAVALDDGETRIIFCIVDTCMMEQGLIDQAKAAAAKTTGIATDHMMVSATHTHSAPSAMACLGSRQDPDYAAWLPAKIAEAIEGAVATLRPAQIGWASVDDWTHTHNRRWIRRSDKFFDDPFGAKNVRAHMHPGYQSRDIIGPSGPVDPGLSVLAARAPDGTPIALLANYSQHYYGSPLLSADYYGAFVRHIATRLGQDSSEGPFVAMMSQGTSGDLMWMDYGSPKKEGTFEHYGEEVAANAMEVYEGIEWHDHVPLAMVERTLTLDYRVPDADGVAKAKERVAAQPGELPMSREDIYAHEALILHERQHTDFKLQAIRIGDLSIATLPNEVYAITGLKLKLQSPLDTHFNIELANGAVGYIPPPEQHELGGYTTWPARTAGLEVQAEPIIVETLLAALEDVSGTSRKKVIDLNGAYADAVREAGTISYWRLNEYEGRVVSNAVDGAPEGTLSGGAALFLPGVGSGTGWGEGEALQMSSFGGPGGINRAIHFLPEGTLTVPPPTDKLLGTTTFWFWLGELSGASVRSGKLVTLPDGTMLRYDMDETGASTLSLDSQRPDSLQRGTTQLTGGRWHFATLIWNFRNEVELYVDGAETPEVVIPSGSARERYEIQFGDGLEGKLDEIALFSQRLSTEERLKLWTTSGISARWARDDALRKQAEEQARVRAEAPRFPTDYGQNIATLSPLLHANPGILNSELAAEPGVRLSPGGFAEVSGGRIRGTNPLSGPTYSVSIWFKNSTPNDARSVTAYLFSRGPEGDTSAPGDHLGIGGTYGDSQAGKLILFNGNAAGDVLAGQTTIPPDTWNHVVFVRDGNTATAYLNGVENPEFSGPIAASAPEATATFFAARSDHFAPLSGYVGDIALFDRALTAAEAKSLHTASGQPVGTPEPITAAPTPPTLEARPLALPEALASIQVPEGYTVDLVASEPQLLDPVAFDWDTSGRLWVVEMADYPLGLDGNGAPGGRVRLLEDVDEDGHFEKSALFADGLNFPTGILSWRDGVIVTAAPDVIFLQDTTGDGKADVREVLLSGLSEGNQQLRANGLRWGLDNWVYVAAGGHHGKYALDTKLRSTRAGTDTEIGSRDFRFNPDTGVVEPQSGPTQFGRNRDDWGHWFGNQNSRPLWHYALPDHYLKRNPYLAAPDGQVQVLGEVGPPVYPASALQKRFHDFKASGRFTSACSGLIYRDELLFPRDALNGFTCEPFHNLIQRIALEPDGVTFRGTRVGEDDGPDFFASTDRWCRPVMVRTGPDGGLWVADMYRYMIEHPQWLPEEGKAELLPFYRKGDERGRIYRVRPVDNTPRPIPNLTAMDNNTLALQLASPNGWIRDKAQQLLLWRDGKDAASTLAHLLSESGPLGQLHALCTLDGLGLLKPEHLLWALTPTTHPGLSENALRLAERHHTPEVVAAACSLVKNPDPKVRQQLAFSLGAFPDTGETADALADLLLLDHEDPFITAAALSSALPHQDNLIATLIARDDPALPKIRLTLADMALSEGNPDALAALTLPVFVAAEKNLTQGHADDVASLLDLLARRDSSVTEVSDGASEGPRRELAETNGRVTDRARSRLKDEGSTTDVRLAAATVLARKAEDESAVVDFLTGLLSAHTPPEHLQRALGTLAHTNDNRVPERIIDAWATFTPPAREQAADVLLSRVPWTQALLDAVEGRAIRPTDLSPVRRTRLLNHPDEGLRALAVARIVTGENSERAEVIAAYEDALTLEGNLSGGQAKFAELCASCHRLGEVGLNVGPDLRTVVAHPKEKLLANILDPNLDIQPGYHAYNCELEDGEQLFGIITSENATSITLKVTGGAERSILRSDIYALESTTLSMMPEGLEAGLTTQDMANLLAFLKGQG